MNSKILSSYSDPKEPGAFLAVSGFTKNHKYKREHVQKVLERVEAVTLHKPRRKKFPRNRFISNHIDQYWMADLCDMLNLKNHIGNGKYGYILTCIDVLSKFAFAVPIKNKTAESCKKAFEEIFEQSGRRPHKIQVDEGNEFKGSCKAYLKSLSIDLYFTRTGIKASIVERFNRTLKEKMYRMFSLHKNKIYVPYLKDLVTSYNNSYHRSIKRAPATVSKSNEAEVFKTLYGYESKTGPTSIEIIPRLTVGDYVRITLEKNIFEKGYTANWSKEIYLVSEVVPRIPPVYKITALDGEKLNGVFYKEELQKVSNETNFDTFEIIDQKEEQLLVKQLNSSDQEENWVSKDTFLQ